MIVAIMIFTIFNMLILANIATVLKDILTELKRDRMSFVTVSDDGLQIVKEFKDEVR